MIREIGVLTGRNLRISLSTRSFFQLVVSPLVFFLGFSIVLDRLLTARGVEFGQFLPPAIIMMAMGLTAMSTAFFMARDQRDGMMTRYRTLPIRRGSVLIARLGADAVRSLVPITVILVAGYATGFRFAGLPQALAFVLLAVAFSLSFAAGAAAVGLRSGEPEAVASMLFLPMLAMLNLSTVFVPTAIFPDWLEPVVSVNPYTAVVDALRALAAGTAVDWAPALLWVAALTAVFGLLAGRALRKA